LKTCSIQYRNIYWKISIIWQCCYTSWSCYLQWWLG